MTKEQLRQKLTKDHDLREQFNFEVEERASIMLEDYELSDPRTDEDKRREAKATAAAREDVVKNWIERK